MAEDNFSWSNPSKNAARDLLSKIDKAIGERNEPELKMIIERAREYSSRGDIESAKTEYRKAKEEKYKNSTSYNQASSELGKLLEPVVQEAIDKAIACERNGDLVGAISALKKVASCYANKHSESGFTTYIEEEYNDAPNREEAKERLLDLMRRQKQQIEQQQVANNERLLTSESQNSTRKYNNREKIKGFEKTLGDFTNSYPLLANTEYSQSQWPDGTTRYDWIITGVKITLSGSKDNILRFFEVSCG